MSKQKSFFFVFPLLPILFVILLSNSNVQAYQEGQNKKLLLPLLKDEKYFLELLSQWKNIGEGIDFRKINLFYKLEEIVTQLRFYRFNPDLFDIRVICSKNLGYLRKDVKILAKLSGSVAIINSSYFDTKGNPIGYLKCNNKILNERVVTHSLYSGFFYIKHGKPHIVHRSNFYPSKNITDAVQAGPRLLSRGKDTVGLKNIHAIHHRSGIALDKKGNVLIFVTSSEYGGISWNHLRAILKLKEIGANEVLNLDGGGSTQMYISTESFEDYIQGDTQVPSAIGFFLKNKSTH